MNEPTNNPFPLDVTSPVPPQSLAVEPSKKDSLSLLNEARQTIQQSTTLLKDLAAAGINATTLKAIQNNKIVLVKKTYLDNLETAKNLLRIIVNSVEEYGTTFSELFGHDETLTNAISNASTTLDQMGVESHIDKPPAEAPFLLESLGKFGKVCIRKDGPPEGNPE
jgi:hypothetical protein